MFFIDLSRVQDRAGSFQIPVSQLQAPRQQEDSSLAVSRFQIPEPTPPGVVEGVVADSRFQIPASALALGVRGQIPDSRFQGGSPEILHRGVGRSFQIPVSASLLEGLEDVRVESEDDRGQIPEWCNERGVSIKSLIAVSAWIVGMSIIRSGTTSSLCLTHLKCSTGRR